jgi:hypothetical protein
MNRAQETTLAWSLIDAVKPVLAPQARVWLCAKIGAGDQVGAINELLGVLADRGVELPQMLWAPLADWMSGYLGSESEPGIRALLARLRVPYPLAPGRRAGPPRATYGERPRRVQGRFAPNVHRDPAVLARRLRGGDVRPPAAAESA